MCDPGAVRRALALSLVTSAACASGGTRLLEGFGQALVAAALIGVVVLAAGLAVYAWLWVRLLRRTRDPAAGAAATRGAFWQALVVACLHVGLVALLSEHEFGQGEEAWWTLVAGVLPVGALLWTAGLTARRGGGRWPVAVGLGAGVGWLALAAEAWQIRPLAELPGQIVQLSAVQHACARLSTGQVACLGANWQGQRGDGSKHGAAGPTLVRGVSAATEVVVASDLGCALQERGPAVCWGGDEELPVPGPRGVPWALPGGEDAAALVASEREIVVLARDGTLRGWPEPPPAGLTRAQGLYGDDDFDGAWFCALVEADALACWSPRWPEKLRRLAIPPPVAVAVDADARVVCAADAGGTVRCFDLQDEGPARTRELPGLRALVAADDDGTFCALTGGGQVLCWRGQEPTRELPELAGAQHVFGGGGFVCGELEAERRCVARSGEAYENAAGLLEHDRAR
jgi:hypothetical protein